MFLAAFALSVAIGARRAELTLGMAAGLIVMAVVFVSIAVLLWRAGRAVSPFRIPAAAFWILVSAATVAFPLTFQPFVVHSTGMENTILWGDQLLVRTIGLNSPARNDIIAFHYPLDRRQSFIKRVVALPGDRVRIDNKRLFVNGVQAAEPFAIHRAQSTDEFRDNFPRNPETARTVNAAWAASLAAGQANGEVTVPPGKLFVMGDDRDNSLDSRYWGFVDRADVMGKVFVVYYSADANTGAVRWARLLHRI